MPTPLINSYTSSTEIVEMLKVHPRLEQVREPAALMVGHVFAVIEKARPRPIDPRSIRGLWDSPAASFNAHINQFHADLLLLDPPRAKALNEELTEALAAGPFTLPAQWSKEQGGQFWLSYFAQKEKEKGGTL